MSVDPLIINNFNKLIELEELNVYRYGKNNPIVYLDPKGLWNVETGEVEKGDTLGSITSTINKVYQTNYDVADISKLNNIENPDKISVGQTIIPNQKIPDVSFDLTKKMEMAAEYAQYQGPFFFREKFLTGGDWDIKNQPGLYNSKDHPDGFVFFGSKIRYDAPGNILYGFVGKATLWATENILLYFAGHEQIRVDTSEQQWQNSTYNGDDPVDVIYIKLGFKLHDITGKEIHTKLFPPSKN